MDREEAGTDEGVKNDWRILCNPVIMEDGMQYQ